jgi:hypothetical protein
MLICFHGNHSVAIYLLGRYGYAILDLNGGDLSEI